LGFQSPIRHNLATHTGSENIVLRATTADDVTGYGEGVPRAFVTGEELDDSLAFLHEVLTPAVLTMDFPVPEALPQSLADLYQQTHAWRCPAAFCAL
jgi:L-alanine-DL-glutamate epimerase-like enolase superfamily enzyme